MAVSMAVAGHLGLLVHYGAPVINSSDAHGYYAQVPRLAGGGTTGLGAVNPLQFIGNAWVEVEDGRFFSKYSPGVAVLLAPVYLTLGANAALWLTPLLASLTLGLLFLWARGIVGAPLAALGVVAYAAQPDAAAHALNWGAHTQVTFFVVLGLYALDKWSRAPTGMNAAVSGMAFGAVPLASHSRVACRTAPPPRYRAPTCCRSGSFSPQHSLLACARHRCLSSAREGP